MLKLVEQLTNKPDWWIKVKSGSITRKWRHEAVEMDWTLYRQHADFTRAMSYAVISELQKKAELYEQTGLIPVMDYSAAVIKSDNLILDNLRDALIAAVAPLENVPDDCKDWHPGSDGKVLDLVHPSLFPLVYGQSRILPDKRINLHDALEHCGMGQTLPCPHPTEFGGIQRYSDNYSLPSLSGRFQWLPCDVVLGDNGSVKIDSYINNLHPVEHSGLYSVLERFIESALPAWDLVYRWPKEFGFQRITTKRAGPKCTTKDVCPPRWACQPWNRPLNDDEAPRGKGELSRDGYEESERGILDLQWFRETHKIRLPDIRDPYDMSHLRVDASSVKTSGFFNGAQRLQIIVKLANIHLTPDKPTYDGGSWHMEGQLNEHICATALFYYDSDNITDCELAFRTPANAESLVNGLRYPQNDEYFLPRTFAIDESQGTLQEIGSVLTRPGRAIFFPNLYQHKVSPFSLADPLRPGHRKILALFLVDPAIPIISTANIPPQQKKWWSGVTGLSSGLGPVPAEIKNMIVKNIDFPIDEAESKKIREQLMQERKVLQKKTGSMLKEIEWNFCEH
jgi:hypothetical protein